MKDIHEETIEASGKVYAIENAILDGKMKEGPNKYNELAQMEGKTIVEARRAKTGMTAVAYKDNETGEIIIAYCGTNPSRDGLVDIASDVTIASNTVQLQTADAIAFYNDVKSKNQGSKFVITGHSLGGGLANEVNLFANGENKSITYNAAPVSQAYRMSSIFKNKNNFTNYRTNNDPLTSVGQLLPNAYPNGLKTIGAGGHDLKEFKDYDAQGEFKSQADAKKANKYVEAVVQLSKKPKIPDKVNVDTNGDSKVDAVVDVNGLKKYKDLLTGSEILGSSVQEVKVTPSLLFNFSKTLYNIADAEMTKLISNVQIMIDNNEAVGSKYSSRILNCASNIEKLLKEQGLTAMVNNAISGYEDLVNKQQILLSSANLENASWMKELSEGSYEGEEKFVKAMKELATTLRQLDSDLTVVHSKVSYSNEGKGHYASGTGFATTTITKTPIALLKDLKQMLYSLDDLVRKEFKGDGNRSIFDDGLQRAIRLVLSVQKKNLTLVQSAIRNAAAITRIMASNFESRDQAIKNALNNKEINPRITELEPIPQTFQKYLEECAIFDDTAGALNAWNDQVKRASKNIETNFLNTMVEVVSKHKTSHDKVYKSVVTGQMITKDLMNEINTKLIKISYSKTYTPTFSSSYLYEKTEESGRNDAGTIGSHIGNDQNTFSSLNQLLKSAEDNLFALSGSIDNFKSSVNANNSSIDALIRNEIYQTVDLDEIETIQQLMRNVMQTMIKEFNDVLIGLRTTQSGNAINALINELKDVIKLLQYFALLSEKSFA